MRVLVVLPTFNEALNIEAILERLRAAVPDADLLVIDDSSPDGTGKLAEKVGADLGQIEVLSRPAKSGLGSAYRLGFQLAIDRGYDVCVEMDSDFSHEPERLPALIAAVGDGADLAIGSRYVPGGSTPSWPRSRRWLSRGGNLYAAAVLGFRVKDATAGFRAYSTDMLQMIGPSRLRAEGYGFQVEMAYMVHRLGGSITELPITFRDRTAGESKMSKEIVVEALALVTWWGLRNRVLFRGRKPSPVVVPPGRSM